jgi:hypothetical protein
MQYIWSPSIDDVIEAIELAKSRGVKAGDSYEKEFLEIMAKKGIKPSCASELTPDELVKEYLSHDKKILKVDHDSMGVANVNLIQKNTEDDDESDDCE